MKPHTLLCLFLFAICAIPGRAEDLSIGLVLDCSASMWNKLEDGRYRIDAAKDVLVDFLSTTPDRDGLNVGLRIYGSTIPFSKAGACQDTALIVPIDGFQREKMIDAVRSARAIGATPLALSLQKAIVDFQKPGTRRLIVCTDGEESCGGDVEAALRALKAAGVDVDVRFIGIGLPEAAAARFVAMGVRVENVNTTRAFADALAAAAKPAETAQAEATPPPEPTLIPLSIRLIRDGAPLAAHEVIVKNSMDDSIVELRPGKEGEFVGEARPGGYNVTIQPGGRMFQNQSVPAEGRAEWVFDLTEAPRVSLEVSPAVVAAGDVFEVKFTGAAGQETEWVGMLPASEASEPIFLWQASGGTKEGALQITAPVLPGKYRMVFFSRIGGGDVEAGESNAFEITLPEITLKVPAEVSAASEIFVEWQGPGLPGDWIGWVKAGAEDGAYERFDHPSPGESPVRIIAPGETGDYEMRYANNASSNVLARAAFRVVEASATVSSPKEAPAGSRVSITWTGPRTEGVFLTIVPAGSEESAYLAYEYTANVETPFLLQTPRETGPAEVRLVAPGNVVLARSPIRLVEIQTRVEAPSTVTPSTDFQVRWQGPGGEGDYITIVPANAPDDAYLSYANVADGEPEVLITSPEETGKFEVRYVRADGEILARQAVEVK